MQGGVETLKLPGKQVADGVWVGTSFIATPTSGDPADAEDIVVIETGLARLDGAATR